MAQLPATYVCPSKENFFSMELGDDFTLLRNVDKKELRKTLKKNGHGEVIKGKKFIAVVALNRSHPQFKNVANFDIKYTDPYCASWSDDMAYTRSGFPCHWIDHPLGDVYIVLSK